MTVVESHTNVADPAAPAHRWWSGLASPGWIALLVALAVVGPTMHYYGVATADIAKFAAYTFLAGTLPGTLIWRSVRGRPGYLPMDAAFGTTIGFAVELPVYMLCRQVGVPPAVVAWPIVTVLLFLAVPRLRRYWLGRGERLPFGVTVTATVAFLFVLAMIAFTSFKYNSLVEPYSATMSMDFPFQFALVGEFKHHVPLDTPWVTGTALQYHWYVYAHGAAASWLTGIEPQTLILRLLPLPMVAAFLLIVIAAVRRITGRWWAGNVAVLLTLTGVAVVPYAWSFQPIYNGLITDNLWVSPTQTYAALFFIAAVYVLAGILRSGPEGVRKPIPWVVFAFLLGAVAGAKATFVPMILCGLLLAVVLRAVFARGRRVGRELVAFGITLFWFGFAQFVLYGSGSQGAQILPLQTIKWTPLGQAVMGRQGPVDKWPPILVLTGLGIMAMAFGWAGMVGLLRRGWRMNPIVHVMLGFAASGVGGLWLVAHPGLSQTYFARSATPYLAILSAVGLAALIPAGRRAPRAFVALALGGGALAVAGLVVIQQTLGHHPPKRQFDSVSLGHTVGTYAAVVAVVAVLAAAVALIAGRVRLSRPYTLAAVAVLILATAVGSGVVVGAKPIWRGISSADPRRFAGGADARYAMPAGAIAAGRWLRDHSAPRDVVATNSHCRADVGGCDSRDFWLAAYSERQIVLEGWSYTEEAFETGDLWDGTLARSTFWDQPLLTANDDVFYRPTAANVASFTRAHRVRWLVAVDNAQTATEIQTSELISPSPALARFATERYHADGITIYEVPAA